ncbi:MAG TPA: hypothetical protein VHA56_04495 [Mucilaginibacter sp.]|nr:hypothetical protein [Mucilaginibacter sp.]
MTKKLILFVATICFGCTYADKNTKSSSKDPQVAVTDVKNDKTPGSAPKSNKKAIGVWTNGNSANATFEIKEDSIYYVDQFKSYKYLISKDSIHIYYPDYIYGARFYFRKDTLIMDSQDDGVSKFHRFKK